VSALGRTEAPAAVAAAIGRIRGWGEARDWVGYDPYDALTSPFARLLSLGTPLGRRVLTQLVKSSPLNLRPLLRIPPAHDAKAIALVASAYARLAAASACERARSDARRWLEWLPRHPTGDGPGLAWGYHFDVQTRFFSYARGTPNTIATSFAAQALLDGAELLGERRWADLAHGAADYLRARMLADDRRGPYFRYLPAQAGLVHNANALACAALVRLARVTGEQELLEPAAAALERTPAAQRPDGSWPYAEGARGDWVDNFHTGYVLESLAICNVSLPQLRTPLERGLSYWEANLFLDDGTPKYSSRRLWPIDAQCYAQAIETWLAVASWHATALAHANRLAALLVARMLDVAGFVHFQQRRLWTSRVPFVRWTTASSFRALAGLQLALAVDRCDWSEGGHARLG
jgi:hypothetical protein